MHKNIQIALRLRKSEEGFALVAAIMACLILLALGMLVASLSTQDIRISTKIVGDKRALAVAEEGIHRLTQDFDPQNPLFSSPQTGTRADGSTYRINYPAVPPTTGPESIPYTGFQIAGGQSWGQKRYSLSVTGTNTEYSSTVTVGLGIGYGPIEISTMYR
jgi:Tfp pilus assembly protein PilX